MCSIDGVLLRGSKAIPQAPIALDLLNQHQIPWILLTNGGGKSEQERVDELSSKLGDIGISSSQFLQSHTPFKGLAALYDRVLVVGGDKDKCRQVARSYGFKDVVISADIINYDPSIWPFHRFRKKDDLDVWANKEFDPQKPFDAILVFNDPRDTGADVQVVLDLLTSDDGLLGTRRIEHSSSPAIPIHFSNNDLLWANSYALPRFGQGAFRIIVQSLYKELTKFDLNCTIIGKPTTFTYDYANDLLKSWTGKEMSTVYMVGDNPASDILGANRYGWKSMLVRTGVFKDSDLPMVEPVARPNYIFDHVLDAVNFGIKQSANSN